MRGGRQKFHPHQAHELTQRLLLVVGHAALRVLVHFVDEHHEVLVGDLGGFHVHEEVQARLERGEGLAVLALQARAVP